MKSPVKLYKKDFEYSYTSGASVTIELLKTRPDLVESVFVHSDFNKPDMIANLCAQSETDCMFNDAVFRKINQKENSYVLGVFKKFPSKITANAPHVVLVNPGDMGNLGTIIRTLVGFNIRDLAIITPAADIWNPKTIRASMGSFFQINFKHYESFSDYCSAFPEHRIYTFMLDGEIELSPDYVPKQQIFSLVFGNEATGLSENFRSVGTSVKIPQSMAVDSLNLSTAVAVGVYLFTS